MHALHKILVRVDDKDANRKEIIATARAEAQELTEEFYDRAFDWRETDTAGRWEDMYPENVLLSKEGIDKFVRELEAVRNYQHDQITMCVQQINKVSTDLETIVENNIDVVQDHGILFEIKLLAELLSGDYVFDSGFFDSDWYSAKLTDGTIDKVKKDPDGWALVLFDYHI